MASAMQVTDNAEARDALRDLLRERYSCRAFQERAVPRETIEDILKMSQMTASWCNSQPWQIHVASREATDRIRGSFFDHAATHEPKADFAFPGDYVGVYKQRRRDCAVQLYNAVGIELGDRAASARQAAENFRFFGAPHFALVTTDRQLGVYGAIDCGAFVGNFLLAARSHGVATIAQAALASQADFFRQTLGLPEDRLIVCGISFGYADETHPANGFRTDRAPLDEVVRWID